MSYQPHTYCEKKRKEIEEKGTPKGALMLAVPVQPAKEPVRLHAPKGTCDLCQRAPIGNIGQADVFHEPHQALHSDLKVSVIQPPLKAFDGLDDVAQVTNINEAIHC